MPLLDRAHHLTWHFACSHVLLLVRVTGKHMHEILLPTCKTLDEVTTLLGSLAVRHKKQLGQQLHSQDFGLVSLHLS